MIISKNTERLLRKIGRVDVLSGEKAAKYNNTVIKSLIDHNFINAETYSICLDTGEVTYSKFWITELGRTYLDSQRTDTFRFWLPLFLSFTALIVSILSIVLSPFFSSYFSHLWGL